MSANDDQSPMRVGRITFNSPEARRRFYEGSGVPEPPPTDEEIAGAIRRELDAVLGADALCRPETTRALLAAARAVRQLFPTT